MGNSNENQQETGENKKEEIGNEEMPFDTQVNNEFGENHSNRDAQEANMQQRIIIMDNREGGEQSNFAQNQMNNQYQMSAQYQNETEKENQPNYERVEYNMGQSNQEYNANMGNEEGEEQENNVEYQEEYQQEQEEGNVEGEYQMNQEIQENQEMDNHGYEQYEANKETENGYSYQINQGGQTYQINQIRSEDQYAQSQINQNEQYNQIRPAIHETREYHYNSGDNSYHVKKEYKVEETFEKNPKYPDDMFTKVQYESSEVNPSFRQNIRINKNDIKPNVYVQSSGYYDNISQNRYQYHSDIPRYMSFAKSTEQKKVNANIRSSLNVVKTENISELVEIPKSQYGDYEGRETIFIGGGMDTGEYKFKGQGVIITQGEVPDGKIIISEEEILKEINRRKNKPRKKKEKRYVVLDRFYATTEFDGKPIKKIEKVEHQEKEYAYEEQQKYYSSSQMQGKAYEYSSEQAQGFQSQMQQYGQSQNQSYGMSMNMKMGMDNSGNVRYKKLIKTSPYDNYSKYLLEQINKIRTDPQSYIGIIEDAKNNIIKDKHGRLIYNGKIKIALTDGEAAFNNAINFLRNVQPMNKLEYNPYITVELPKTENELKYKNDLTLKIENMVNNGINVKSYWRDVIKDPEISFLMMIVDDNGIKSGMRRKDLLDPNMKYIGISSIEINGNFVCYITLSSMA